MDAPRTDRPSSDPIALDSRSGAPPRSSADRWASRFWTALLVLVVTNLLGWAFGWAWYAGARSADAPALIAAVADADFARDGALEVRFDRDVFDASVVGEPLGSPPLRFEPPIAGTWRIDRRDGVRFDADEAPRTGRRWQLRWANGHRLARDGERAGALAAEVRTPPLRLLSTALAGTDRSRTEEFRDAPEKDDVRDGAIEIASLAVTFDDEVATAALRAHVTARVNGALRPVRVRDGEPARTHELEVDAEPGATIVLTFDPELAPSGAERGLGETLVRRMTVPMAFTHLRTHATSTLAGNRIDLRFSRALALGSSQPAVVVEPSVGATRVRVRQRSLVIEGAFDARETYTVRLQGPVLARDGSTATLPDSIDVTMPAIRPAIRFIDGDGRLSSKGRLDIAFEHAGIDRVEVSIERVPEEGIGLLIAGMRPTSASEIVASSTVRIAPALTRTARATLALEPLIGRRDGVYVVRLRAPGGGWISDSTIVTVGDLVPAVRRTGRDLVTWITEASTGSGAPAVRVRAWDRLQRRLAEGVTDADGLVRLRVEDPEAVAVITASDGDRHTWIRSPGSVDDATFDGATWPEAIDVALHLERPIVRPGELVRLGLVARTDAGRTPIDAPIALRVRRSDGRVRSIGLAQPDADQGHAVVAFDVHEEEPTGTWTIEGLLPGSDVVIGRAKMRVLPLVPVRLELVLPDEDDVSPATRLLVVPTAERAGPDAAGSRRDAITTLVASNWLHGAPAADVSANVRTRLVPLPTPMPGESWIGPPIAGATRLVGTTAIRLDADGTGRVTFEHEIPRGTWLARSFVAVTEPGGSSTSRVIETRLERERDRIGVERDADGVRWSGRRAIVISGRSIALRAALFDDAGAARENGALDELDARLVAVDRTWIRERGPNGVAWRSVEVLRPMADGGDPLVALDGDRATIALPALPPGEYRLVVSHPAARELPIDLHAHAQSSNPSATWRATRPDRVDVSVAPLEPDPSSDGVRIPVTLIAPFAGRALVTITTDACAAAEVHALARGENRISFAVPAETADRLALGGFVGVLLTRAVDFEADDARPVRAIGRARIAPGTASGRGVERADVALDLPSDVRPGATFRIRGAVAHDRARAPDASPALAHVWMVDEGAMRASGFEPPDLAEYFVRARALRERSTDGLRALLPDHRRPVEWERIGAGVDDGPIGALPIDLPEIAHVHLGVIPIDASGAFEVEAIAPDLDGAIRVVAVVIDGARFGSAETIATVRAPLRVELAAPPMLAPGDEAELAVVVRHRGEMPATIRLATRIEGALSAGALPPSISLAGGESVSLPMRVRADGIGPASIAIDARIDPANEMTDENREGRAPDDLAPAPRATPVARTARCVATITVRPATGRTHRTVHALVPAGESRRIALPLDARALDRSTRIRIGGSTFVTLLDAADALVAYPHGCSEQIGSRVAALLALLEIEARSGGTTDRERVARALAEEGLRTLWSRQRVSGGIPYWSGGGPADPWCTIRATRLALHARDLDVAVPDGFAEDAIAWVVRWLRSHESARLPALQAHALAVLARTDELDEPRLLALFDRRSELDPLARAHLLEALLASGIDDAADRLIVEPDPVDHFESVERVRRHASLVQADAVRLRALLADRPDARPIAALASRLEAARSGATWRNTADTAAALTALARFARTLGEAPASGRLEGTPLEEVIAPGETFDRVFAEAELVGRDAVTVTASADAPLLVAITCDGYPADVEPGPGGPGFAENAPEAAGLLVARRWLDPDGSPLESPTLIDAGTLVLVEVELRSLTGRRVADVVVEDVLPAGFRFELPELDTGSRLADRTSDGVRFGVDRLHVYGAAAEKPRTWRWLVRATTPGRYAVPAPTATSMYDPSLAARGSSGTVRIVMPEPTAPEPAGPGVERSDATERDAAPGAARRDARASTDVERR